MKLDIEKMNRDIETFNQRFPVGARVRVRLDLGDVRVTTVTAPAQLLGGHTPVVWLEGIRGCYLLGRVTGIETEPVAPPVADLCRAE